MADRPITRRSFTRCLAAGSGLLVFARRTRAADFTFRQYHNQPVESPLHARLVEMWAAVGRETGGRIDVRIFPENNYQKPADPNPLDLLASGALEFYTNSGNGLASIVPPADVQATPLAFHTREQVFRAIDSDIGDYLRAELRAKGLYLVPFGGFENGFHQFTTASRAIRTAADLQGLRLRAPGSPAYLDFFHTFGATTTSMNIRGLYAALKAGTVEAQEDPLDIIELLRLYEVQRHVAMTHHSWSGYNLLANLKVWNALPDDIRASIERHARRCVALQRQDMDRLDRGLRATLTARGMVFTDTDMASFRPAMGAFYMRWRAHIGERAWRLLEGHVGRVT